MEPKKRINMEPEIIRQVIQNADWTQTYVLMGLIMTLTAFMCTFMFFTVSRIDSDVRSQGARIDQLYQMFVDLLKETKK